MRLYLSADIEGIAGIAHIDECDPSKPDYAPFRELMTAHVAAACEGAVAAGAEEILVKDAHWTARNIDASRLPECARVVRGWSGHPLMMVQEIDDSFDALAFVGYHARASSGGNPLAHTMSSSKIARMEINGIPTSELRLHAYAGAMFGVPTVFVSGDEAICAEAKELNESIHTAPVMMGVGDSSIGDHPTVAERAIRDGTREALRSDLAECRIPLPESFKLRVRYHKASYAYAKSFYPGARLVDEVHVEVDASDYFEVLRAVKFLI